MKECLNKCKTTDDNCEYCQQHYNVSKEFYKAKRQCSQAVVQGYLVKNKDGTIHGILTEATNFNELVWIDEDTLIRCK